MRTLLLASALLALAAGPACVDRGPAARPAPPAGSIDTAPFALTLKGHADADGVVTLDAELALAWPLDAPLLLTLELPSGAALDAGLRRERLDGLRPATSVTRRFVVRGAADRAIVLRAEQLQGDLAGAHATRTWPEPPEPLAPAFVPVQGVHLGQLRIDEAVPLSAPGKR